MDVSLQGRDPYRGLSHTLGTEIHVCTEIHQIWGWSSKHTVLEVEGTNQQGHTCCPKGQSSWSGPQETSQPATLSAPRKEASGLVPVVGASVCRDLSTPLRVFSENSCRLSGCGAEAALAAQAEVIEMMGQPGAALGPAAGLWEFRLTGVGFGAHTLQMGLITSRVPAHKLN